MSKTWIVVIIALSLVLIILGWLYQQSKVNQIKAENEKLALIYGGLANTKVASPIKDFFNSILGTVFTGASQNKELLKYVL